MVGTRTDCVDAYCEDMPSPRPMRRLFGAHARSACRCALHAEQLSNVGGSQVAARHGALSCDHSSTPRRRRSRARTCRLGGNVMLPVAFYALERSNCRRSTPSAATGADAVASDCNPGSAARRIAAARMNMARRLFGLRAKKLLLGVTRHAARALGLASRHGSLARSRRGLRRLVHRSLDELGYWTGFNPAAWS